MAAHQMQHTLLPAAPTTTASCSCQVAEGCGAPGDVHAAALNHIDQVVHFIVLQAVHRERHTASGSSRGTGRQAAGEGRTG